VILISEAGVAAVKASGKEFNYYLDNQDELDTVFSMV
jgi:hypothetical protein